MRRKRKLFYVETGLGAGIRDGLSVEEVKREELRRAGEYNGVKLVREATPEDCEWVHKMGGHIPLLRR